MRTLIAIAAATLVLSVAAPAAVAGPPEYNRGYYDCQAGRYDEGAAQYSRSYRQGCRAAQEESGGDEQPHHWRPSHWNSQRSRNGSGPVAERDGGSRI